MLFSLLPGIQTAGLLNASWSTCDEVVSKSVASSGGGGGGLQQTHVYIHVKALCSRLLGLAPDHEGSGSGSSRARSSRGDGALAPRAYHVYDVVDATADSALMLQLSRHVDALVMSTHEDLQAHCRSRLCYRIPHHYNLNCSVRVRRADPDPASASAPAALPPGILADTDIDADIGTVTGTYNRLGSSSSSNSSGSREEEDNYIQGGLQRYDSKQKKRKKKNIVVGLVGTLRLYGSEFTPLAAQFAKHNISLRRETAYKTPCAFFAAIDIALAWSNPKHTSQRDLMRKPAERFTNPIVLNIPTIGSTALASFRLPGGGAAPFLCSRAAAVLPLVLRIARGELEAEFRALRRQVLADVGAAAMVLRYRTLLADLAKQPPVGGRATRGPNGAVAAAWRAREGATAGGAHSGRGGGRRQAGPRTK